MRTLPRILSLAGLCLLVAAQPCRAFDEKSEGLFTSKLNSALSRLAPADSSTSWASTPKFGGYIIGRYTHSTLSGASPEGFDIRLLRTYVSGTVLRQFDYFVQLEMNGTVALRDAWIGWRPRKEFGVQIGQFKRRFTIGSTHIHPWENRVAYFPQLVIQMAGYNDYCGATPSNGRDIGLMVSGQILPIGADAHPLIHYEAALQNGNGINRADNNSQKDVSATLLVQPLSYLWLGVHGWRGNYLQDGVAVGRNRWALSARLEKDGWSAHAEYAHNTGHRLTDFDADTHTWTGTGRSDGWYVTLAAPLTRWLQPALCYDAFRSQATWASTKSIYSLCLNFRLHQHLLFQLQMSQVDDRPNPTRRHYQEYTAEAYIRF